ncbi:MAG TPA: efflux RND transporter periplasmic adaptor subunit [Pirellulales bacterium]|nr:efflux RND transporter periplasmic adaptor subunit [Pirellulales bacterium]
MVTVTQPQERTIHRTVAQPGMIMPYEQTAIYSKVAGFVQKWNVDIGAHVKKDDLLAEILVPELAEELKEKEALVEQQEAMVKQSEQLVHVAESNSQSAEDAVAEAQANVARYTADVERWQGELDRLNKMVKDQVVNPEVLAETQNTAKASKAAYDAAVAAVKSKESERLSAVAQVDKSKADLNAAQAQVKVAQADERRVAAMFAYTKITAPYDGVITTRNINTGDFVRPASGDASGGEEGGSTRVTSIPLFVVARTDPMMFVIGVPEMDAPYVSAGTKASLRLQALAEREYDVPVTRTSLALRNQSRTLQAEIDLPNPKDELLPGMYAYGSIEIERPKVWAIPNSAIVEIGNRMCCYLVVDGVAARTQIQAGISDGAWTEVVQWRPYPSSGQPGAWEDFNGSEHVIDGDLSEVSDGKQVAVEAAK